MLIMLTSCARVPDDLMKPSQNTLKIREAQSRSFETYSDGQLLRASLAVLQDMGYTIKESSTDFGVLTANKEADARSAGQVIGAIAVALLGGGAQAIDMTQFITVTIVVMDKAAPNQSQARTTFQRVVQRTDHSYYANTITEPEVYSEFYEKLDKALFLEVNKI